LMQNGEHGERWSFRSCCSFGDGLKQEDVAAFWLPCREFQGLSGFVQYQQQANACGLVHRSGSINKALDYG